MTATSMAKLNQSLKKMQKELSRVITLYTEAMANSTAPAIQATQELKQRMENISKSTFAISIPTIPIGFIYQMEPTEMQINPIFAKIDPMGLEEITEGVEWAKEFEYRTLCVNED